MSSHNFFVVLFLCFYPLCLAVQISFSNFHKVETSKVVHQAMMILNAMSHLDCDRKCYLQKCACFSFSNHICSIGKCNSSNTPTGPAQEIYVSCFSSDGFTFITIGSVSACVWVSTIEKNYTTARDECRGKDAYLYTVKTMEKLKWLQSNYNQKAVWIGLNDIDVEGTYRWEDDNTVCSQSWINQSFVPGEPNNQFYSRGIYDEDCIRFFYNVPLLNDAPCVEMSAYICEKPFFNFP